MDILDKLKADPRPGAQMQAATLEGMREAAKENPQSRLLKRSLAGHEASLKRAIKGEKTSAPNAWFGGLGRPMD